MPVYLEKTEKEAWAAAEKADFVRKGWIDCGAEYKARLVEFDARNGQSLKECGHG